MNHIAADNTAEWDARVRAEEQRKEQITHLIRVGTAAGLALGLGVLTLVLSLRASPRPAVAAPAAATAKAAAPSPVHLGIPLHVRATAHRPAPDVLKRQAQDLAVGLARVWRGGSSDEASAAAHSYTVEYERMVGCDLRWIAGRAGPGVWEGTPALVGALLELTPYVGRAREGEAVVVTAVICPPEGEIVAGKLLAHGAART